MKYHNTGFSIIFALGFMLLSSLVSLYLLSFIIPFGRSVKGIEFATNAYYNAYSGVEEALYLTSSGAQHGIYGYEGNVSPSSQQDYGFDITSTNTFIPVAGQGDSEYDSHWNTISLGQPIQLFI